MFPTALSLEAIRTNGSGEIGCSPFAEVLRAVFEGEVSGSLVVHRGPIQKRVVLESGVPVDCQSNLANERLGRFLIAGGKITEPEYASCYGQALKEELPLGQMLVLRGVLTPRELFRQLQENLARKLLDLFSWTNGEWRLVNESPELESALKVNVHQLILTGLLRFATQEAMDLLAMSLLGQRLVEHPYPPFDPSTLRLGVQQQFVLADLQDGPRELSQLGEVARLEPSDLARTIYAFGMLGLVCPEGMLEHIRTSGGPSMEPITAQFRAEVADETALYTDDELLSLYLEHRRCDPLELLELPEEANPREIETAFLERTRRLRPERFRDRESLYDKASELLLASARAYAALSDREQRAQVIARRRQKERDREQERAEVGPQRIETDLLDPEAQYQKGMQLVRDGQITEALQYLEFAADCDSQNGRYQSEYAFQLYSTSPGRADQALDMLATARRVDKDCGVAYYYAGEILGDLQRYDEAKAMLESAIRPMAPDRRPIEALKTLSKSKGKGKAKARRRG